MMRRGSVHMPVTGWPVSHDEQSAAANGNLDLKDGLMRQGPRSCLNEGSPITF